MFESFEKQPQRKSVVQPVLALVVHAGLISLALRGGPSVPSRPAPAGLDTIPIFVPRSPVTSGAPLDGGTGGIAPVSTIDMPPGLPPLTPILPGPMVPRVHFDPGPYRTLGTPDTTGIPGIAVLTESDLTDPPRSLHLAEPRYPEALRQAGIEGSVTVTYVVDAAGLVEPSSIRIVSSDHRICRGGPGLGRRGPIHPGTGSRPCRPGAGPADHPVCHAILTGTDSANLVVIELSSSGYCLESPVALP